jgi:ABC-type transport system involved in multi-copper enzyme maturation permease subunit
MRRVWAISLNTFRETVRDKVLYSLLFFAVLMIGGGAILAELAIGEYQKIIKDLGLAAISIFGIAIAVFLGIGLVSKEIERKTIYTIASKPVRRWQFLLGKYLGLALTLLVEVAVMAAALAALLVALGAEGLPALAPAVVLALVEMLVVTAVALFFGSFTSPMLAALFTIGTVLIGKSTAQLVELVKDQNAPQLKALMGFVYRVVPDLATFDVRTQAAYGRVPSPESFGYAVGYGAAWVALLLVATSLIFQRRDFK